jgi:hypothetical protein
LLLTISTLDLLSFYTRTEHWEHFVFLERGMQQERLPAAHLVGIGEFDKWENRLIKNLSQPNPVVLGEHVHQLLPSIPVS